MDFMRREYPEVVAGSTSHGRYSTVVTMDHAQEDIVDIEGIEDQPNELLYLTADIVISFRLTVGFMGNRDAKGQEQAYGVF